MLQINVFTDRYTMTYLFYCTGGDFRRKICSLMSRWLYICHSVSIQYWHAQKVYIVVSKLWCSCLYANFFTKSAT